MHIQAVNAIPLPEDLKKELHIFCEDIIQLIKDDLGAIILYGGVAKEEFDVESSDINLMIVLKRINVEILDKINPRIQKGVLKLTLAPFILSEDDIKASFNLFPIKFLDIKQNHIVLWGKDYLGELTISEEFLKRNCQRELKNLSLRLNLLYFQNYGFTENLGLRLRKVFPSFLIGINTLLFLKTGKSYQHKQEIMEAGMRELKLETSVMIKLMNYKTGKVQLKNKEVIELYNSFMALVRNVSSIADKL
jgi:hypothetical protein